MTYLAGVISVRDLLEQVAAGCPSGTTVTYRSWLSPQFWPEVHMSNLKFTTI